MQNDIPLKDQSCENIAPGNKALIIPTIESLVAQMEGWEVPLNYITLEKTFKFKNYHQTVSFVNAVTWIAHKEDHHPEICFGYNECKIVLTTHAVKGLSQNDFIVAAKIDALLD
ncbi:MAG: 4a-hydroxytetrahydrobiopterin dehydratase [Thiotrichales bacterium]|nr:4a-hydroxytetrahydrobiopterin dehydratase [Thiotrichales bacterium]